MASSKGMKVKIEDGVLVIKIPVEKDPKPSSTGKTLGVATSHGNVETDCEYQGKTLIVGLNAYVRNRD